MSWDEDSEPSETPLSKRPKHSHWHSNVTDPYYHFGGLNSSFENAFYENIPNLTDGDNGSDEFWHSTAKNAIPDLANGDNGPFLNSENGGDNSDEFWPSTAATSECNSSSRFHLNLNCEQITRLERQEEWRVAAPAENSTDVVMFHAYGANEAMRNTLQSALDLPDQEDVCFGMISATMSNSNGFGAFIDKASETAFEEVTISQQGCMVTVYNTAMCYLGMMDSSTWKAITYIAVTHSIRVEAYINVKNIGGEKDSKKASIFIVLYGSPEDSDAIGDYLSDRELFLQHPPIYNRDIQYRNPQYYYIQGMHSNESNENVSPVVAKRRQLYDTKDNLMRFFNTITDVEGAEKCLVSDRISTPLLDSGGILADEMGLGKSLTTLALIAGSLSGPKAERREENSPTLLITPTSTLVTWQEQIEKHTNGLNVLFYYGDSAKTDLEDIESFHIVLTTYSRVTLEWIKGKSALHKRKWFRIVLDEAHFIKDRSTQRSKAMCSLDAEHRWCLSGTPIQNSINDLGALLKFLKVYPYDTPSEFHNRIIKPLKDGEPAGLKKLRFLLSSIAFRRTKGVIQLPPRVDVIEELQLSSTERGLYEISRDESMDLIDSVLRTKDYQKQFYILQHILRQRQICNHGADLLPKKIRTRLKSRHQAKSSSRQSSQSISGDELSIFCEFCEAEIDITEYKSQQSFDSCLHIVCSGCLYMSSSTETESRNLCPICGDIDGEKKAGKQKAVSLQDWFRQLEYSGPSTKVLALIDNIKSAQREHTGSQPIKSIVFSSWTKMLYLIEIALKEHCIGCLRLDGTLTLKQRQKVMEDFNGSFGFNVLLASIGSGGVGLNLTAASEVHLIEPQWNPMAESQALDRVHRLGQSNPVKTIRYIVKSSFEESIVDLQKMKLQLVDLSLRFADATEGDKIRARLMDLRALFK